MDDSEYTMAFGVFYGFVAQIVDIHTAYIQTKTIYTRNQFRFERMENFSHYHSFQHFASI